MPEVCRYWEHPTSGDSRAPIEPVNPWEEQEKNGSVFFILQGHLLQIIVYLYVFPSLGPTTV